MIATSRASRPLRGTARLPGDKSISHRAAVLAALAEGRSRAAGFLRAGVTQVMLDSLAALGVAWRWDGGDLNVDGAGRAGFTFRANSLGCGNSATTLRLLAGALAGRPAWRKDAGSADFVLDGSSQLRKRPMGRLLEPLLEMGARIHAIEQADHAPLRVTPSALHGITFKMPVASAQVKTAILLAGLAATGPTIIEEPSPSRDHTERFLRHLGVPVESDGTSVRLHPLGHPIPALDMRIPGDFSSAAFLIVAATIVPGSDVVVEDVGLNPRRTGLLVTLRRMGADIEELDRSMAAGEPVGTLRVRHRKLSATVVDGTEVVDMIDEFPVFAVAAAMAEGTTVVRQAAELRHKESDRIAVLAAELRKIGITMEESPDGFAIRGPSAISGGRIDSHGDHRLAMALAVAGLVSREKVEIQGAECVSESFPGFFETMHALGADLG